MNLDITEIIGIRILWEIIYSAFRAGTNKIFHRETARQMSLQFLNFLFTET